MEAIYYHHSVPPGPSGAQPRVKDYTRYAGVQSEIVAGARAMDRPTGFFSGINEEPIPVQQVYRAHGGPERSSTSSSGIWADSEAPLGPPIRSLDKAAHAASTGPPPCPVPQTTDAIRRIMDNWSSKS